MTESDSEQDEGFGYAEGEESHESPETLSPDERGEETEPAEPSFHEPKEP